MFRTSMQANLIICIHLHKGLMHMSGKHFVFSGYFLIQSLFVTKWLFFWAITMWSASLILHLVASWSLRYNPNKEERNGLPSAEKIPQLPCSWAACLGADGEDKTQCSSHRLFSKQFALNVMWSSINDAETLVLIQSGITSSDKNLYVG